MKDRVSPSSAAAKCRSRRPPDVGSAVIGLLAALGLLAAACGGGGTAPRTASGVTATTSAPAVAPTGTSGTSGSGPAGQANQSEQLQFSQCMRSNGAPNFPDPGPGGLLLNAIAAAGIDTHSPSYQAALQACKKYNPAANLSPAQSAAQNAQGLEFSQCMRSHGVPNFPDPTTGPTGEPVINLRGLGIDTSGPTFQAANQACQKVVPGSK
jgi:hypothetical protein